MPATGNPKTLMLAFLKEMQVCQVIGILGHENFQFSTSIGKAAVLVLDFPPFHHYNTTQDDLVGQGSRDRCKTINVDIMKYTRILVNAGFQALICKVELNGLADLSDLWICDLRSPCFESWSNQLRRALLAERRGAARTNTPSIQEYIQVKVDPLTTSS